MLLSCLTFHLEACSNKTLPSVFQTRKPYLELSFTKIFGISIDVFWCIWENSTHLFFGQNFKLTILSCIVLGVHTTGRQRILRKQINYTIEIIWCLKNNRSLNFKEQSVFRVTNEQKITLLFLMNDFPF